MIRKIEKIINEIIVELISATRKLDTLANQLGNKKKSSNEDLDLNYFSKENFLKLRFQNREDEFKEYLKLSNFKGKNRGLTQIKNIESEIVDDMKYSISFREKENRYMGRFTFNGKREYAYGKTRIECLNKLRQKKKEVLEKYSDTSTMSKNTLNNWFEYWFNNIYKPRVKESTFRQTLELYNRHVEKSIGSINVKKLTTFKLQKFINQISSHVAKNKINTYLKNIFDMLQKMAVIKINPMALVVVPKKVDEKIIVDQEETKILSYEEERILLEVIKGSQCYHAVKFILYTGLRKGECIGLQWKHIDLEKMQINIKQQFNYHTNQITTTKSKAGNRTIPLLPEALEVLKEINSKSNNPDDFVFTGINRITQQLVYYSGKLDFKVNPHMLRHTFASRCYFTGLDPKIIQSILGHENMDTTLNTYTHVLDVEDKIIINKMKDYFVKLNLINKYN